MAGDIEAVLMQKKMPQTDGAVANPIGGTTVPFILLMLIAAGVLVWGRVGLISESRAQGYSAALVLLGLFITGLVKDYVAALLFIVFGLVLSSLPAPVVLNGFSSPGAWMVIAGMVIAATVRASTLSDWLVDRLRVPGKRFGATFTLAALAIMLILLVPSATARALMLIPVASHFAEKLDRDGHGNGTDLILTTLIISCFGGLAFLPASLPNIAMVAAVKNAFGYEISVVEHAVKTLPVAIAVCFATYSLCKKGNQRQSIVMACSAKPLSADARQVLLILICAIVLWLSNDIHGVGPAWIALGAAVGCLLGPGQSLSLNGSVRIEPWIVFGSFISLGAILLHTGTAQDLGNNLAHLASLRPGAPLGNFIGLTLIGTILCLLTTDLAAPIIYASMAGVLSAKTDLPIDSVLAIGAPTWIIVPFTYQSPVLALAAQEASVQDKIGWRLMTIFFIYAGIALPIHFVWLSLMGIL